LWLDARDLDGFAQWADLSVSHNSCDQRQN
jgi:hypothetical protein